MQVLASFQERPAQRSVPSLAGRPQCGVAPLVGAGFVAAAAEYAGALVSTAVGGIEGLTLREGGAHDFLRLAETSIRLRKRGACSPSAIGDPAHQQPT